LRSKSGQVTWTDPYTSSGKDTKADRWVDVTTGDLSDAIGYGDNGEAKCKGNRKFTRRTCMHPVLRSRNTSDGDAASDREPRPMINEFTGQPFHIALARPSGSFEFSYAEIGLGTTSVTGDMEMAYEDSWAHYCIHHFNQDGLVRERSRLTAWLERIAPSSRE
jgi:hypothetical protein